MGLTVVRALLKDSTANPTVTTPAMPIPTATIRSGANANVGRARETSHMPIAVIAPVTTGGIFRSSRFIVSEGCVTCRQ